MASVTFQVVLFCCVLVCVCVLVCAECKEANEITPLVFHGEDTDEAEQKHLVLLDVHFGRGNGLCSASVISDRWILSAAHCVINDHDHAKAKHVSVSRAVDSLPFAKVTRGNIIPHPDYTPYEVSDLSLLRTSTPMKLHGNLVPIKLNKRLFKPNAVVSATIAGYGNSEEGTSVPRKADVTVSTCSLVYDHKSAPFLCSYDYSKAGRGDSGGSLVSRTNNVLLGVTSMVMGCELGYDETHEGRCYTYYVDVSHYSDWIQLNTGIY